MENNFLEKLAEKIEKGEENSPFLFIGQNLELVNSDVHSIANNLLAKFWIPKVYLYILADNWETIKIEEIKIYLTKANTTPAYDFQIFLIENVSRMTIGAANSTLKFLEEPGKKNIIFLTNKGETWILDTILSRVQTVNLWWQSLDSKDEFFYSMIDSHLHPHPSPLPGGEGIAANTDLISYFFRNKPEKDEYIRFLQTIVLYTKDKNILNSLELSELLDDINAVALNNVAARGVVDKWILKLR